MTLQDNIYILSGQNFDFNSATSRDLQTSAILETSDDDLSGTGGAIDVVFDSTVVFSQKCDCKLHKLACTDWCQCNNKGHKKAVLSQR